MEDINEMVLCLSISKPKDGCAAMKELINISEYSDTVYPYMNRFFEMLDSKNSYVRTRALLLICTNSKWDSEDLINKNISKLLTHIHDEKPITARQFIGKLPLIVRYKKELANTIISALQDADTSSYADSMKPLVDRDIKEVLEKIKEM